jgi:hypothetical protein
MRPATWATLLVGAVTAAAATRPGTAQVLSAAGFLSSADHRVEAGFGLERSSGWIGGARVTVGLQPRVEIDVTALAGALERDSANAEDRGVAEIRLDARYRTLSWLWLETGVGTRTYSAPIAVQRWTALRLGAEARVPFFGDRAEGVSRLLLLPLVSVTGLDQPELALTAAAGIEYRFGPVMAGVFYWLERYDFPVQDAVARAEQLSGLLVRASARVLSFRSR